MSTEQESAVRVAQEEAAQPASSRPGLVCAGKLCVLRGEVRKKIPEAFRVGAQIV